MDSCTQLWRKLPYDYQRCLSFHDFWKAYNAIPAQTHQIVGKETGQTAHVERLNNTLRQRLSRLVRKSLSFSKKLAMVNLHLKLFFFYYNLHRVSTIV